MAEFAQTGAIVTLHRLGGDRASAIEADLERFARTRPIALVLPCLFSELSRPALRSIVNDLRHVRYLERIVVSLGDATPGGLQVAQRYFSSLPQDVVILWNDGPRIQTLYSRLRRAGVDPGCAGKGRAFWIACGYVLARGDCDVIAAHDCDITTYSPELLARLCFPVAHPDLAFQFVKGYYARLGGGAMHGRVTRLFVAPLLRALQAVVGPSPALAYLDSFRYPLAGEFAMTAALARVTNVPADWGLEIGMLTDVYRNCDLAAICQSELCDRYDHKHQVVGDRDCGSGLLKMCVDIARSLVNALAGEGLALTASGWDELVPMYRRIAAELMGRYHADAAINGLSYSREGEDALVSAFAGALQTACDRDASGMERAPLLPGWAHVASVLPDFGARLVEAVELDGCFEATLSYGTG